MYASHLHSQPLFIPPTSFRPPRKRRKIFPSRRVIRNVFQKKKKKSFFLEEPLKNLRERINDEIEKLREKFTSGEGRDLVEIMKSLLKYEVSGMLNGKVRSFVYSK